jgi:hypothetical protein
MDFERFSSLTRFSQGWTITEKLDGTNAQVAWRPKADYQSEPGAALTEHEGYYLFAGSRNRWLSLDKDNMGFARFVSHNVSELFKLGEGRHFGEWYGSGIKRGYGLTGGEKRFALFNSLRWKDNPDRPQCCEVVHTFIQDEYLNNPDGAAQGIMTMLKENGSYHAPGFMDPEGIVMFHRKSGVAFKKTFDYDEQGKWAEMKS